MMPVADMKIADDLVAEAIDAFRAGHYGHATQLFQEALEQNRENPIPWSYMGCIHRLAARYGDALSCYDRALELTPDHWPARLYRTLAQLSSGDSAIPDEALVDFLDLVATRAAIVAPSMMDTVAQVILMVFAHSASVPEAALAIIDKNPLLLPETILLFDKFVPIARFEAFFKLISNNGSIASCFTPLIDAQDIPIQKRVTLLSGVYRMVAASSLCHLLELPETNDTVDALINQIDAALLAGREPAGVRIRLYNILNRVLSATPRMAFHDQGLKRALDDYGAPNHWPSHILSVGLMDLPDVVLKNWKIPDGLSAPDTKWVTLGSCFAENVAIAINNLHRGKAFSLLIGELFNNTIFNYHLVRWIISGVDDNITAFIDGNIGEFWSVSREYAREKIENADVIVITLGVSRARWWLQADMPALALGRTIRPPRDGQGSGNAGRDHIVLRDISLEENLEYLERILALLSIGKPKQFILSVSPVPLGAVRDHDENAVVADCLSKSCLRLVAERITAKHSHVHYWPSFEIIKWLGAHVPYSTYSDSSHPERRLIERILQTFLGV